MFTQKELYCITQVSKLIARLAKSEKKINTLTLSKSKKEAALQAALKKYTAERAEEQSIRNQMIHFRQVLAESLRDVHEEPTKAETVVAKVEPFEYTGREA